MLNLLKTCLLPIPLSLLTLTLTICLGMRVGFWRGPPSPCTSPLSPSMSASFSPHCSLQVYENFDYVNTSPWSLCICMPWQAILTIRTFNYPNVFYLIKGSSHNWGYSIVIHTVVSLTYVIKEMWFLIVFLSYSPDIPGTCRENRNVSVEISHFLKCVGECCSY